jgi:poly-beta-1,6-N-acetyl-D-glucosamine synthase
MDRAVDISYVIITPCFNEEKFINFPLKSVLQQTIAPKKWIIIDDESSDSSAEIIKNYAEEYDWIEYLYNKKIPGKSYYSNNVYAILSGLNQIKNMQYTYLAILDADIELCSDYYERIIDRFRTNESLGIASGTYLEIENGNWIEARIDRRSTPKAIQVFRRECYEKCGGYIPFEYGGEDSGMEILARMNGWETWSFDDIVVKHHRPVGTGDGRTLLMARYRLGITDYCLGTHLFFMVAKSIKRMLWEKPYILSGFARLAGFIVGFVKRYEQQLPKQAIEFLRDEQLNRLLHPKIEKWKHNE